MLVAKATSGFDTDLCQPQQETSLGNLYLMKGNAEFHPLLIHKLSVRLEQTGVNGGPIQGQLLRISDMPCPIL